MIENEGNPYLLAQEDIAKLKEQVRGACQGRNLIKSEIQVLLESALESGSCYSGDW